MTNLILPDPIAAYFEADQRGGEAVARCFTTQAVVKDEGRTYAGLAAIKAWKAAASAKYTYTSEPFALEQKDGGYVVTSRVTGNFPGQPGRSSVRVPPRARQDRVAGDHAMSFDLQLTGRRALVTGGTEGIGAAVVKALRDAGAQVIATARSLPSASSPKACAIVAADLSTAEGAAAVAQSVLAAARGHRHPRQCASAAPARPAAGLRPSTMRSGRRS